MLVAPRADDVRTRSSTRRRLILNDAVSFLALLAVTLAVLGATLVLFRSFARHRADLARTWADRGQAALATNQPEQAVGAYRAALQYAPGDAPDQRKLAQALVDSGRTEEATNYFLEMWAVHPGDGFLNLQLARLARQKAETQRAVNFYRGALYGTWEGDGVVRRRDVRLELAEYLIAQKQFGAARAELLVAEGNAPDTLAFDKMLADLLSQAQAPADAIALYKKALALAPGDLTSLRAEARLTLAAGDLATAQALLQTATAGHPAGFEQDEVLLQQVTEQLHPQLPRVHRSRRTARTERRR